MLLLAFLGGILTILSPCILPIIPLVFSRADRSMTRETIPMLAGLAVVFAIVASLATVSAAWIARANEIGRIGALGILAAVSLSLLLPAFAEAVVRPLVRLGAHIETLERNRNTVAANFLIGGAIGLLWSPCAGPILGLVIAGAALEGSGTDSIAMFVAFAAGAVMSLAIALFAGGRVLQRMKRYAGLDRWVRRSLGAVGLAGVFVIAAGWDQQLFARGSAVETAGAEKFLVNRLSSANRDRGSLDIGKSMDDFAREKPSMMLSDEGPAPEFAGGGPWINSSELKLADLRGKVVMVQFWTFACYNCLNALPHVKALEAKYRNAGLIVVGVHTPELPHEKIEANVRSQVKSLGIVYPVVIDNGYKIWNSFHNQYWPAAYFIDAKGRIRYHHFGEGKYDEQDKVVAQLLTEVRQTR